MYASIAQATRGRTEHRGPQRSDPGKRSRSSGGRDRAVGEGGAMPEPQAGIGTCEAGTERQERQQGHPERWT